VTARRGVLALSVLVLALAAGCGSSGSGKGQLSQARGEVKFRPFPALRVEIGPALDSLDPGLSYTIEGWQILWNVYLSPLGYTHANGADGAEIVPALAEEMPKVTGDGLNYSFRLREGLRYSNGKPVRASDFEFAIRRLYILNSPGASLFDDIAGANRAAARSGDIAGITTDDGKRTVTIKLRRPRSDFANALASLFAAPVPRGTPMQDRTRRPIPSTGPYAISEVVPTAKIKPLKSLTLTRNSFFEPTESVPETNPDRITARITLDGQSALQEILVGRADYSGEPVANDSMERVRKEKQAQLRLYTGANTYYFFMNTKLRPFNDVRVRRAVNYALDRNVLTEVYGGLAVPTENVLPPVYPSYKQLSLYPYNLAKARALVREAGAEGAAVTVYGIATPAAVEAVYYLQRQLKAIGLKPRQAPELLDPSSYWATVGNRRTKAKIGFAYWIQSYPNPLEWFVALFDGSVVRGVPNSNYSFADIPAVNATVARLSKEPQLTSEVDDEWAALDEKVMRQALIAPFLNRRYVDIFSNDLDLNCYVTHVLYQVDFGRLCRS